MSIPREQIMDAIAKARTATPERRFEQSIEMIVNLREVDMKRPENRINLRVQLPNRVGAQRILVFASGDLALRARRAGADGVIEPSELDGLAKDKKETKKRLKNFDVFVSEAPLMPTVGRVVGPVLGPSGKMPTPVPPQAPIDSIIDRERKTIIVRSKDKPQVQCVVGNAGMGDDKIAENIEVVLVNLTRALKRGLANVRSVHLKLSMGPAIKFF
jgi:large subunit ribosomal protein L1